MTPSAWNASDRIGAGVGNATLHVQMESVDIVQRLEDWVGQVLTDPRTGVPPDAKLRVRPSSNILIGHIGEGDSPSSGVRTRGFNLEFSFPVDATHSEVDAVADTVREGLGQDPTLGGRFPDRNIEFAELRPLEPDKGSYGEGSGLLTLRVRVRDLQPAG